MVDPCDLTAVRALLERERFAIMEQFAAAGVGVGKHGNGYAIVVYLTSATSRPALDTQVEGVPLKFEVTGPFKTVPS
ncbi:MAG: hypothetical protein H7Z40_00455 [Phycisphaerae bacterium]|nr:hypothetical protein [Gemmatimonadaceae bacterium]